MASATASKDFQPDSEEARRLRLNFVSPAEPLYDLDDPLLLPLLLLFAQWRIPVFADHAALPAPCLDTAYYFPEKKIMQIFSIACKSDATLPALSNDQQADHDCMVVTAAMLIAVAS